jgi:hypothetical protein
LEVGTTDFSSFIADAKAAGAQLLAGQMTPADGVALWQPGLRRGGSLLRGGRGADRRIEFSQSTHAAITPYYITQWQNGKLSQVLPPASGVPVASALATAVRPPDADASSVSEPLNGRSAPTAVPPVSRLAPVRR